MEGLAAYCPNGHIFSAQGIVGGSGTVIMTNNLTLCPVCGEPARIADGTYQMHSNRSELIDGPPLTKAIIERLKAVVERAQESETQADEFIAQIEAISPDLAKAIRPFAKYKTLAILFAIVWAIINMFHVNVDAKVDLNELIYQMSEQVDPGGAMPPKEAKPSPKESPKKPELSRQQRRHLERQANKRKRRYVTVTKKYEPQT